MDALLLTGGSGLLGRAVQRIVAARFADRWDVVAPSHTALDVCDAATVHAVVAEVRPRAVVHAAYVQDGSASRPTIVDGSANVAAASSAVGARLVHLSTDVVFAGRPAPYVEHDEPDPVHDYGRAKLDAERLVATHCPGAVLVRTSLLYGDAQSPPVRMVLDAVASGRDDVRFFTDEVRSFSLVDDVALAVVELVSLTVDGPLHVAGPEPVSRYDFARAVCRCHGLPPERVIPASIAELGTARPGRVVLDSSRAAALVTPPGSVSDRLRR